MYDSISRRPETPLQNRLAGWLMEFALDLEAILQGIATAVGKGLMLPMGDPRLL